MKKVIIYFLSAVLLFGFFVTNLTDHSMVRPVEATTGPSAT